MGVGDCGCVLLFVGVCRCLVDVWLMNVDGCWRLLMCVDGCGRLLTVVHGFHG